LAIIHVSNWEMMVSGVVLGVHVDAVRAKAL
jgi:hypothetical protein